MRAALSCLIILIILVFKAEAQRSLNIGLHFNFYRASEDFRNSITRQPIGSSLILLVDKSSKLQLGTELGIGLYSGKKYYYETIEEGYPGNVEYLYEEDGFFQFLAVARYKLISNRIISFYGEGKLGGSIFFSAIRTLEYSAVYEDKFRFHESAFNIGGGIGANIDIGQMWRQDWRRRLLLDCTINYIVGTKANYRNSIKNEYASSFGQGYRSSSTSTTQIKTGVILNF